MQNTTSRAAIVVAAVLAVMGGAGALWWATRASAPDPKLDSSKPAPAVTADEPVTGGATTGDASDGSAVPAKTAASASAPNTSQIPGPAAVAPATPLPPADTPLAQVIDDLERRARAGDTAASCRLGFELLRCRRAADMAAQRVIFDQLLMQTAGRGGASGNANSAPGSGTPVQRRPPAAEAALVDYVAQSELMVEQAAVVCAGIDPRRHATPMDWLVRAASAGDPVSRAALLSQVDAINQGTTLESLDALARFRTLAPAWVAEELEQGSDAARQVAAIIGTQSQFPLILQALQNHPALAHALVQLDETAPIAGIPAIGASMRAAARARLPPADAAIAAEAAVLAARYRAARAARGPDRTAPSMRPVPGPMLGFDPGVSAAACGRTSAPGPR